MEMSSLVERGNTDNFFCSDTAGQCLFSFSDSLPGVSQNQTRQHLPHALLNQDITEEYN